VPLYEYRCDGCQRSFAQLIGVTADSACPRCPKCGCERVTKLISRFSRGRGEDEMLESLEDAAMSSDVDDPRAMRRLMREMGSEMGDELGEDVDELIDQAESDAFDSEE